MDIKIKYPHPRGITRIENNVEIKEVMIKGDLLDPYDQKVVLGFSNDHSSGVLEFSHEEFEKLMKTSKDKLRLVKDVKIFKNK